MICLPLTQPSSRGRSRAKLSATPTNAVRLKGSGRNKLLPLEPPLWLDCHYELGALRETISMPVTAKNN